MTKAAAAMDPALVTTVAGFLKGKRREKFLASIAILNESLALGGWVPRGNAKAGAGFSGISSRVCGLDKIYGYDHELNRAAFGLFMALFYGGYGLEMADFDRLIVEPPIREALASAKLPEHVVRAWVALGVERKIASAELDAARPPPRITPIGLSPKVTATLTEMNLDLDLPSIAMAKIAHYDEPVMDEHGNPKLHRNGEPVMRRIYYVDWSDGIKHDLSRFADSGRPACHACGKSIPSRRFVPVEARCKRNGLVSLWLGCDCARNIFGIKDVGIEQGGTAP